MTTTTQRLSTYYDWAMSRGDPRTHDWLLMSSPGPVLAWIGVYLFVVKVGPKLMENKKAFQLNWLLVVYNFGLVLLSAYMCYEFIAASNAIPNFNFMCHPVEPGNDPRLIRLASVCWLYFFSKLIEFFDTGFFILRKKATQISVLHTYHHTSMLLLWWVVVKWVPGGVAYFGAMCNCFIHTIMYLYYMLSAMGPQVAKYLWWKKYLTKMQLTQFAVVLSHTLSAIIMDCGFPKFFLWLLFFYMITLSLLFANFYRQAYIIRHKKTE